MYQFLNYNITRLTEDLAGALYFKVNFTY